MKASLTALVEAPFRIGVFERIEDGRLSVCKVTFGAEPKCQKAVGEHRYGDEITAGSSKTAGRNENGTKTDQPGGSGCRSPAPI